MVDIKEVSKRAALQHGLLDCQAAFLRKPHERMPFFFSFMSITSESIALSQKQYVILSTAVN